MDVEALQAQIDLSNSIAYDLVSSWVKPSKSSSSTSVAHTISRELEEYAKRPPRLGLGATFSQSSLATSREAARLKGNLVGQKRRRDEGNDHGRETGAKRFHNSQDEEDDGESRSAAISTKKATNKRGSGQSKPENMAAVISTKEKSAEGHSHKLPSTPVSLILTGEPIHTLSIPTSKPRLASPAESRPSPLSHEEQSPVPSQSAPLLNLHGPPIGDEILPHPPEEGASPKRKKRKRRRGKGRKNC